MPRTPDILRQRPTQERRTVMTTAPEGAPTLARSKNTTEIFRLDKLNVSSLKRTAHKETMADPTQQGASCPVTTCEAKPHQSNASCPDASCPESSCRNPKN